MDRKIVKKDMLPFVESFLDTKGYSQLENYDNMKHFGFSKISNFGRNRITFTFGDSGFCGNSLFHLRIPQVEDIILKVGIPNMNLTSYYTKENFLYTIKDTNSQYKYPSDILSKQGMDNARKANLILTKADIEDWKECFVDYFENAGAEFATRYAYLPNVLEKLDEIMDSGKKSYKEFICGRTDQFFRALIISKLCGDDRFEEKKEYAESIILMESRKDYHPYYKLLKEELDKLDPIYN
ncbi:hypothetical protein [Portibacter lacus]|uniref:DUF4304 domain-containing protein n=1 Tax=Portibacter lacus TaxID=1099794 RepID=A0AA37WG67_9BACT|nr:hypothetical protein [Portibacter lacus]GLR19573.1 hypothetical protein GCM10007940_41890 [Portibacter lacus]